SASACARRNSWRTDFETLDMSTFFHSGLAIPAAIAGTPASSLCPGDLPLVLLPVRLETRFGALANGATELRVRVFPDKIHIDSHEPDLTADEQTWGQHYWTQNWLPASDKTATDTTWGQNWVSVAV